MTEDLWLKRRTWPCFLCFMAQFRFLYKLLRILYFNVNLRDAVVSECKQYLGWRTSRGSNFQTLASVVGLK